MEDKYIDLAKKTVEEYLRTGKVISVPKNLPEKMISQKAGVFVSIHKKNGDLRGCIGTFAPTQPNIAQEIIHNAIESATQDPRFLPITATELPELLYSVDILSEPVPAKKEELNPKKYGLIVAAGDGRRGLLLPDLEGVNSIDQQIEICRQKAGIDPNEPVTLYKFTVERHA